MGSAVLRLTGGADVLGGDELPPRTPARDAPGPHRDRPLPRSTSTGLTNSRSDARPVAAAPHLPARVPRVAQDHRDGPQRPRCTVAMPFRCGSTSDGHGTPRSVSSRAMPAMLRPVNRCANIHCTCGPVTGSRSNRCSRRPQRACARFGCGPASTSRYPYGGRHPVPALLPGLRSHRRQYPVPRSQHLALRLRTEHDDQRLRHRILALHRPPASGSHICTPARSNSAVTAANSSPENARCVLADDHRVEPSLRRGQLGEQRSSLRAGGPRHPPRTALVEELDLHRPMTSNEMVGSLALPRT